MSESEATSDQDDVSFIRTDDMVCLQCSEPGERVCLAAEGFGNRHCFLESIANKNYPPEMPSCVFVIEQALSVRALQEMVTAEAGDTRATTAPSGTTSGPGAQQADPTILANQEDGGGGDQEAAAGQQEPDSGTGATGNQLVVSQLISGGGGAKSESGVGGGGAGGLGGGNRTLLYGHAVLMRHLHSAMYLATLPICSSSDKLAFDVGLKHAKEIGESCWWTVHPGSKQRSEGEKVRVGDDLILVSVATERYLHYTTTDRPMTPPMASASANETAALNIMLAGKQAIVNASFHSTHWSIAPFGTGLSRMKNVGYVFGGQVLRLLHGGDECLTIAAQQTTAASDQQLMDLAPPSSGGGGGALDLGAGGGGGGGGGYQVGAAGNNNLMQLQQQVDVIYEGGAVVNQARSLWRLDLIRTRWSGGFVQYSNALRIRHITTGKYLGVNERLQLCLLAKIEATVERTAFCLKQTKDDSKGSKGSDGGDDKDEEVIGLPMIKYGESSFFIQHIDSQMWLSYRSYETKRRGIGRVEEKQAILSAEGKMDDCLEFSRSQEEEAKTARVIRKCDALFSKFIKILDHIQLVAMADQQQQQQQEQANQFNQFNEQGQAAQPQDQLQLQAQRQRSSISGGAGIKRRGSVAAGPIFHGPSSSSGVGAAAAIRPDEQQQQQQQFDSRRLDLQSIIQQQQFGGSLFPYESQVEMSKSLEDLIDYFAQPEEGCDHEQEQNRLRALRNRQDLFQEEGILNLILDAIDKINLISSQGLLVLLLSEESSSTWDSITGYFYQLLAAIIKDNHTNCAQFAQSHRLNWLFSRLSSQQASEGTGMLDVLHCVLVDSPEALNMLKESHIKVLISLLEKHGRDPKVLNVLCSLCVSNGVAIRSSQNTITNHLLPGRNLLLQTRLADEVASMRPNIYIARVDGSAMYHRWYYEVIVDHVELINGLSPHLRIGWANTKGYLPYPGGGFHWGANGVGDDFYSYGFDGQYLWTAGKPTLVRLPPNSTLTRQEQGTDGGAGHYGDYRNQQQALLESYAQQQNQFVTNQQQQQQQGTTATNSTDPNNLQQQQQGANLTALANIDSFTHSPYLRLQKNDVIGCLIDLSVPTIQFTINGKQIFGFFKNFNVMQGGFFHPVISFSAKVSCRFLFGSNQGELHYRPPSGFSPLVDVLLPNQDVCVEPCFSFGDLAKQTVSGPQITPDCVPQMVMDLVFIPKLIETNQIELTRQLESLRDSLAENMHEMWCMSRIEDGWIYGDEHDDQNQTHPYIAPFSMLPTLGKKYKLDLAAQTIKIILGLGYKITPTSSSHQTTINNNDNLQHHQTAGTNMQTGQRLKTYRLPNVPYMQSNGYKPAPLDLGPNSGELIGVKLNQLVELLAENIHNIWAAEKISLKWSYKRREPAPPPDQFGTFESQSFDNNQFGLFSSSGSGGGALADEVGRSCHLLAYKFVDDEIKLKNRQSALETVLTITAYGYHIEQASSWPAAGQLDQHPMASAGGGDTAPPGEPVAHGNLLSPTPSGAQSPLGVAGNRPSSGGGGGGGGGASPVSGTPTAINELHSHLQHQQQQQQQQQQQHLQLTGHENLLDNAPEVGLRHYRAEKTYAVQTGRWYYEVEINSLGHIQIGWANLSFHSNSVSLGCDENSWAFDCHTGRKVHASNYESFGQIGSIGDVIGCMLDLNDRTISYSLNGKLMLDYLGNEMAFAGSDLSSSSSSNSIGSSSAVEHANSFVPAISLGVNQRVRLCFGQDVEQLKYFTDFGLQEGYHPFCVNMHKPITLWYNKREANFVNLDELPQQQVNIEVTRLAPGNDSPPALKVAYKQFESQERANWEYLRLSLPVTVNCELIDEADKISKMQEIQAHQWRLAYTRQAAGGSFGPGGPGSGPGGLGAGGMGPGGGLFRGTQMEQAAFGLRHPARLEQHMLQSGFSLADVKDLQRSYQDQAARGAASGLATAAAAAATTTSGSRTATSRMQQQHQQQRKAFAKTQSVDQDDRGSAAAAPAPRPGGGPPSLAVPSFTEAQHRMLAAEGRQSPGALKRRRNTGVHLLRPGSLENIASDNELQQQQQISGDKSAASTTRPKSKFKSIFGSMRTRAPSEPPRSRSLIARPQQQHLGVPKISVQNEQQFGHNQDVASSSLSSRLSRPMSRSESSSSLAKPNESGGAGALVRRLSRVGAASLGLVGGASSSQQHSERASSASGQQQAAAAAQLTSSAAGASNAKLANESSLIGGNRGAMDLQQLDKQTLDLIDEYCYGVRIFPGQEPAHVLCGWVTSRFKHANLASLNDVQHTQVIQSTSLITGQAEICERRECYLLNAGQLYKEMHPSGSSASSPPAGGGGSNPTMLPSAGALGAALDLLHGAGGSSGHLATGGGATSGGGDGGGGGGGSGSPPAGSGPAQAVAAGQESASSRSNRGMLIGCHVDTSTGLLTFTVDGRQTRHRFLVEPQTKLYPAIFFQATTGDCLQFELSRAPLALPLSAAILSLTPKHVNPQCPPRLKVQTMQSCTWSRVPNTSLRPNSLKLSDARGWSMLADDPLAMLLVQVPEEDRCLDVLELIEHEKLLKFHSYTLILYGALCAQGNHKVAHIICSYVDQRQLLYAINSDYLSGDLRLGFADLLVALHLEFHAYGRYLTQNEFIVPITQQLCQLYSAAPQIAPATITSGSNLADSSPSAASTNNQDYFSHNQYFVSPLAHSFSQTECVSIRTEMSMSPINFDLSSHLAEGGANQLTAAAAATTTTTPQQQQQQQISTSLSASPAELGAAAAASAATTAARVKSLSTPYFPIDILKRLVFRALDEAVFKGNLPIRDLPGGSNENLFVPLLKLADKLLLIGCITNQDLNWLLSLIDPDTFSRPITTTTTTTSGSGKQQTTTAAAAAAAAAAIDSSYLLTGLSFLASPSSIWKPTILEQPKRLHHQHSSCSRGGGLLQMRKLDEHVKLIICHILHHLLDIQLRHRIESIMAFSVNFVGQLQLDQRRRYNDIKNSNLPSHLTARKTREFRCTPREQMRYILNFKNNNELDESNSSPSSETLRQTLKQLHSSMMKQIKVIIESSSSNDINASTLDASSDHSIGGAGETKLMQTDDYYARQRIMSSYGDQNFYNPNKHQNIGSPASNSINDNNNYSSGQRSALVTTFKKLLDVLRILKATLLSQDLQYDTQFAQFQAGSLAGQMVGQTELKFVKNIVKTIVKWAEESTIENKHLVRQMFHLLLRCYNGVGELIEALNNSYVIGEKSKQDVVELLRVLSKVRALLAVQMGPAEEEVMRDCLWTLVNNVVFFQHPDLIRILRVHENVMHVMMNTLSKRSRAQAGASSAAAAVQQDAGIQQQQQSQQPATLTNQQQQQQQQQSARQRAQSIPGLQQTDLLVDNQIAASANGANDNQEDDISKMVVSCCRFLCFFCRSSGKNQKAMFDHLGFLLENSNILLSRPSLRGSTPLDVAYSSLMENHELVLALRESYLEKIAIYLSRCGLQSNQELIDKGYTDVGWDPVEGERYLDFLRFCVWVNGESVEENSNLVIRLLIRRPECLGPALRGEGPGLFAAIKDAIAMADKIHAERQDVEREQQQQLTLSDRDQQQQQGGAGDADLELETGADGAQDEDEINMGSAILNFYCALVDLLGRCAPDLLTVGSQGKHESIRARSILRSLVPIQDLKNAISLRFALVSPQYAQVADNEMPFASIASSFMPNHKQSLVLFLERVYGIDDQATFFALLEEAFLPDMRAATMLERCPSPATATAPGANNSLRPDSYGTVATAGGDGGANQQQHQQQATDETLDEDSPENEMTLALNRYLGNSAIPLLIRESHYFKNAENYANLLEPTLHTVYRLSKVKILTKGQRESVSDFLIALTREMQPHQLLKLLRKLTVDVAVLNESTTVALRLLTLHYERCSKYYGYTGNAQTSASGVYGTATEEERRLTMVLFTNIFDSLSLMDYDPELFENALPCLNALACALPPDYSLTESRDGGVASNLGGSSQIGKPMGGAKSSTSQTSAAAAAAQAAATAAAAAGAQSVGPYVPQPVATQTIKLNADLRQLARRFSEHFHDAWASRKLDRDWTYGEQYNFKNKVHPRLKPYSLLSQHERERYIEPIEEAIKALIAMGWSIERHQQQQPSNTAHDSAGLAPSRSASRLDLHTSGSSGSSMGGGGDQLAEGTMSLATWREAIQNYNPQPIDTSNLSLSRELQNLVERSAENAHDLWAKRTMEDWEHRLRSTSCDILRAPIMLHPLMVPYDLLTDRERRKNRDRSQELLKYILFEGYRVYRQDDLINQSAAGAGGGQLSQQQRGRINSRAGAEPTLIESSARISASSRRRFAYSILDKLLAYTDTVMVKLELWKPSSNFSRRSSFKQSDRDVKFFSKVVLPLIERYFTAHREFFLNYYNLNQTTTPSGTGTEPSPTNTTIGGGGGQSSPTTDQQHQLTKQSQQLQPKGQGDVDATSGGGGPDVGTTSETFATSAPPGGVSSGGASGSTGFATIAEKEMLANLFCKLASVLRNKLSVIGPDAKIFVRCLQVLTRCLDARSLSEQAPDFIKTSMLNYFNKNAQDLSQCVYNLQMKRYNAVRGTTMRTSSSLYHVHLAILPILTALFDHLASSETGKHLLLDEIQLASQKIFQSLYILGTRIQLAGNHQFSRKELERHRHSYGNCQAAFAAAFPIAFLEPELIRFNRFSALNTRRQQQQQSINPTSAASAAAAAAAVGPGARGDRRQQQAAANAAAAAAAQVLQPVDNMPALPRLDELLQTVSKFVQTGRGLSSELAAGAMGPVLADGAARGAAVDRMLLQQHQQVGGAGQGPVGGGAGGAHAAGAAGQNQLGGGGARRRNQTVGQRMIPADNDAAIIEVILPLLCSYLPSWYVQGPEAPASGRNSGAGSGSTNVGVRHLNDLLRDIMLLIERQVGVESSGSGGGGVTQFNWMVAVAAHASQIIIDTPESGALSGSFLSLSTKVAQRAESIYHREELMRGYLKSTAEDTTAIEERIQEEFQVLVRDIYAFYPLLIKYVDFKKSVWLKPQLAAHHYRGAARGGENQQQQQQQQLLFGGDRGGSALDVSVSAPGRGGASAGGHHQLHDNYSNAGSSTSSSSSFGNQNLNQDADQDLAQGGGGAAAKPEQLLFHQVATVFDIWSNSQYFRREEQNFISLHEIDNMALIMQASNRPGRTFFQKSDPTKSSSAGRKKRRRSAGSGSEKRDREREVASSLLVVALKRLLPIGMNLFEGRERELVQHVKERFLKKEPQSKIEDLVRFQLTQPYKIDPSDEYCWQHYLYSRLGAQSSSAATGGGGGGELAAHHRSSVSNGRGQSLASEHQRLSTREDHHRSIISQGGGGANSSNGFTKRQVTFAADGADTSAPLVVDGRLVSRIVDMARVFHGLHIIDHPNLQQKAGRRSCVSTQRRRVVIACFRMTSLHSLPNHRAINIFLRSYCDTWLLDENLGQEKLIEDLTQTFEQAEMKSNGGDLGTIPRNDPLSQLIMTLSRQATTEHGSGSAASLSTGTMLMGDTTMTSGGGGGGNGGGSAGGVDKLYLQFAGIFRLSCGGGDDDEEDDEEAGDEENDNEGDGEKDEDSSGGSGGDRTAALADGQVNQHSEGSTGGGEHSNETQAGGGGGGDSGERNSNSSIHEQEIEKQRLLFQQSRLSNRGVAEMILLYISAFSRHQSPGSGSSGGSGAVGGSASGGSVGVGGASGAGSSQNLSEQTPMILSTLKLGISILRGGNVEVQRRMLKHLKDKRDVGFFTSIQMLLNSCSVLDLDAFERNQKAEALGVRSEGTASEKNMYDAEFTCKLFRFFQLLCEGHNLEFQNYLRTQTGNTTTVNVVISTVDYLLRLQESIMDFYWHYSSKDVIDASGTENFIKAITIAKQVFCTLTESIQGPCPQNQQALAHSRLWHAVGGFLFLFAHMQDKLSRNSSQLNLLIELLDLQKEMVIMMLSMLEGNVVNGTIGKQMVETLVESSANVEIILKFFDMFLKLPRLTSSTNFQEYDKNGSGWITLADLRRAMEQQKIYTPEETQYLLSCCEQNHDGMIDYREFIDRFHQPAKDIGFNLAVLLTNLAEHITNEPRLQRFLETASTVLNYFEPYLGRIEIMGSSKRIERVYFEVKESTLDQWAKPQIQESKRAFFYSIVTEGEGKEKLEAFVNFCEDTIFEMQHASNILGEDAQEPPTKADKYPFDAAGAAGGSGGGGSGSGSASSTGGGGGSSGGGGSTSVGRHGGGGGSQSITGGGGGAASSRMDWSILAKDCFWYLIGLLLMVCQQLRPIRLRRRWLMIKRMSYLQLFLASWRLVFKLLFGSLKLTLTSLYSVSKFTFHIMTGDSTLINAIQTTDDGNDGGEAQTLRRAAGLKQQPYRSKLQDELGVAAGGQAQATTASATPNDGGGGNTSPIRVELVAAPSVMRASVVNVVTSGGSGQDQHQVARSSELGAGQAKTSTTGGSEHQQLASAAAAAAATAPSSSGQHVVGGQSVTAVGDELGELGGIGDPASSLLLTSTPTSSRKARKSRGLAYKLTKLMSYNMKIISFLARNFYRIKLLALVTAFVINFILLFYKVTEWSNGNSAIGLGSAAESSFLFVARRTLGDGSLDGGASADSEGVRSIRSRLDEIEAKLQQSFAAYEMAHRRALGVDGDDDYNEHEVENDAGDTDVIDTVDDEDGDGGVEEKVAKRKKKKKKGRKTKKVEDELPSVGKLADGDDDENNNDGGDSKAAKAKTSLDRRVGSNGDNHRAGDDNKPAVAVGGRGEEDGDGGGGGNQHDDIHIDNDNDDDDDDDDDDEEEEGEGEETDLVEWVIMEEKYYYLQPILTFLATIHSVFSLCMLIAYYHLKVPLVIFKREKEIARKLEFDGLYITEEPDSENWWNGYWDRLVISAPSFPFNYWDKFVKKRVREKYREQYDYETLSKLLGMKRHGSSEPNQSSSLFKSGFFGQFGLAQSGLFKIDWRYQLWKAGVTLTDQSFQYQLLYLIFSVAGHFNSFFFAAHLLDVAVGFKKLQTILQSVTHNGKQLVLTVMLLTIVVYIYTVIAFNFFRKFYVQGDESAERKCHSMMTCFVYHLYQGVRAGGGIGDVIEAPDGDDYEVYRIIFDITFFFSVIIILLAIIQGLIIDAFGELRDQLLTVASDMESNCFICGIGKDVLDKVPRGFDTHVQKEHNLANYMFFLMHLINKPDTDYTGQETYVWELYQRRCWDFFPVGECFRTQSEEEADTKPAKD